MIVSELFLKPRRIKIFADTDMEYFLKIYNGKKDIYRSVYNYDDVITPNSAIVDKIFLDFDFNNDMIFLQHVRTVAQYLYNHDYLFYIRFSGRGFHIFILLNKDIELQNPKNAIKNYVKFLHEQTRTESDSSVVGDLRRVARVPNSLNIKDKDQYYCISLQYDELMNMTYEEIRTMAKNPRDNQEDFLNGHRLLDIKEWDNIFTQKKKRDNKSYTSTNVNAISNEVPLCVQHLMSDPMLGNAGRIQVILCFRELGYTEEEVEDILYSFLSEEKFNHTIYEEDLVNYLFQRDDYLFPTCFHQKENGYCVSNECQGHKLYY